MMNPQEKPLVSVIIPLYNNEKYIGETIRSALSQTYSNLEVIVIDDGSTDSSADVVKNFEDKRVKYHYQENRGTNWAKNKGIELAQGEYIAILDSDDVWFPHKIQSQLNEFFKNPRVGLVYGWVCYIDGDGNPLGKKEIIIKGDHFLELLLRNYIDNGSVPLIKRTCIDDVGHFLDGINKCQEWDISVRVGRKYKFACVNDYICKYRIHSTGASRKPSFYEAIKEQGLTILDREFSQDYPGLDKIKSKAYSNRYRFLAGICLTHKNYKEASYNLYKAIETHPLSIFEKKTIISLCKLILFPIIKR